MDARPPRGPAPSAVRRSSKSARSSKYTEKRKHGVWLSSVSGVHFPPTEALTFRTLASRACGPGRRWTPGELAWAFLYGAWRTADLPFASGHKSRLALKRRAHLSAAMLAGVEAAWPYCRDLRILVEAPDRILGASLYCLARRDHARRGNRAARRTLRAHRRRGLAGALLMRDRRSCNRRPSSRRRGISGDAECVSAVRVPQCWPNPALLTGPE